jgi:glucose/arabinose dehydrogenase
VVAALAVGAAGGWSCFSLRGSRGGGQTEAPARTAEPSGVALLDGYQIERAASGLTFPTGVAFDARETPFVLEAGYVYGEQFRRPRLLEVAAGGVREVVAGSEGDGPWNGVDHADGAFFVAEGGTLRGGRVLRLAPASADRSGALKTTVLVDGLPSRGDHHTNGPVVRDGWVYFGQGTATNAAVVGEDNASFGWLKRAPQFHDVPCKDVTLAGVNFESSNPLGGGKASTGAYLPFGTASRPGQVIKGQNRCTGAILRVRTSGGEPELVAWGMRNPYGLAFDREGQLYATDNGYDVRGSRGVFGAPDLLWRVTPGGWHGWPDFVGDRAVDDDFFQPPDRPRPQRVLQAAPGVPPKPVAKLAVHSSSDGIDVSRSEAFGFVGQLFIAQFGDQAPAVGKVWAPVGFKVIAVDPRNGEITDFAVNAGDGQGPASRLGHGGLERPVAVRFSPDGRSLYVVDFGVLRMDDTGKSHAQPGTGVLWKITRTAPHGGRAGPLLAGPLVPLDQHRQGRRLFLENCNFCHPAGHAGLAPALNNKPAPKTAIRLQVRQGLGAMPSFSEQQLSDQQLDQLVDYVVALRKAD